MNSLRRLILVSFCLLTACAPPNRPAEDTPVQQQKSSDKPSAGAATISSWVIKGAMAAKNKSKGWSASMNWVQHGPNSYQIRLMGPLGSGAVVINKQKGLITLQDGAKRTSSTNANELLAQQTGVSLPVDNLFYWVRGLPAPAPIQSEKRDPYNHLTELNQSGYSINFAQYTSVNGVELPKMIHLTGNGIMIKVVIKKWDISS